MLGSYKLYKLSRIFRVLVSWEKLDFWVLLSGAKCTQKFRTGSLWIHRTARYRNWSENEDVEGLDLRRVWKGVNLEGDRALNWMNVINHLPWRRMMNRMIIWLNPPNLTHFLIFFLIPECIALSEPLPHCCLSINFDLNPWAFEIPNLNRKFRMQTIKMKRILLVASSILFVVDQGPYWVHGYTIILRAMLHNSDYRWNDLLEAPWNLPKCSNWSPNLLSISKFSTRTSREIRCLIVLVTSSYWKSKS